MKGLREELARVGITGRLARRIELELDDHARCDPGAELGPPELIARRFAEELRLPRTKRATYAGFGALAVTAFALGVSQRALSAAGGWPDLFGARGAVSASAGLAVAVAAQVAFVAGILALWRGRSAHDLRLAQRRLAVALAAGVAVLAGELVQSAALRPLLPSWWFALAIAAVAVPGAAIAGAAYRLRCAVAVTARVEPATQPFPAALVLAIGVSAVSVMTVGSTVAERSWIEGVFRGVVEAIAFTAGFLVLGRRLGIRR